MGYESKLYIVRKTSFGIDTLNGGKVWAEVIASFRLAKCPPVADFMRKCPNTDCYIYADDGDTQILEDRYGEPLTESDLESLIEVLEKESEDKSFGGVCYRRIMPLLVMLKQFNEDKGRWENLKVLHFGY